MVQENCSGHVLPELKCMQGAAISRKTHVGPEHLQRSIPHSNKIRRSSMTCTIRNDTDGEKAPTFNLYIEPK